MDLNMRILALLLAACSAFGQSSEERTRQALDQLLAHKFREFYAMFSPEMKSAISLETYSGQMEQILTLGAPRKIDAPRSVTVGGSVVVVIGVHWAPVSLDFQVSWNKAGEIDGTYWRPAAAPPAPWRSPPYAHTDSFTATEITVGDDRWRLPGTLTVPKGDGRFPVVVLVHGSGPHDRDESVGGSKIFRDLAEGLSSRGVAVLRYVKRTQQYPSQCLADPDFTVNQETVEDAVRAAFLLRRQARIDPTRVFVLGHSQGGYMAPRIMKRDPKLAGFIVMAGNVRPMEELIVEQAEYMAHLKGKLTADDEARLEAIRKNPFAAVPLPAPYLADLKGYRPDSEARQCAMSMLILQGQRDYQVTMKDFALWQSALEGRHNVSFRSYAKLNHLFIAGEGQPSPAEYGQSGHVAEEVVADIAKWIQR
jgi:dienelactone hydrolase